MSKLLFKTLVLALATTSLAVPRLSEAQEPTPAPVAGDTVAPYVRADLNMTYNPPAGWKVQNTTMVKAEGADDKAAACIKILFSAAPESAAQGASGMSVGLTLINAARTCVAKDLSAEDQLKFMVESLGTTPGMKAVKGSSGYFIDGHTFWAMVAKGRPKLTDGSAAPADIYMAWVGGVVKEQVFLWELTAADLPMLQQMLTSTVQFTGKQPHVLYKVNIK